MTDNPGTASAAAGPPLKVDHLTVYLFWKAHGEANRRLGEARRAGNEEEVRRLFDEVQVLWWKARLSANPALEVPPSVRACFDAYPDHPPLFNGTRPPKPRTIFLEGRGASWRLFSQARARVRDRLVEVLIAGDLEEARRLDEEAEVLHWKTLVAMKPDREVPAAIVEKFDEYEDHPRLPAACRAMLDLCPDEPPLPSWMR